MFQGFFSSENVGMVLFGGAIAGVIAFLLYRSELIYRNAWRMAGKSAACLRAAATFLVVIMLLEPTLRFANVVGDPEDLLLVIDDSQSMLRKVDSTSNRWNFAAKLLTDSSEFRLDELAKQFNVSVVHSSGSQWTSIWDSKLRSLTPVPSLVKVPEPKDFRSNSEIGELILSHKDAAVVVVTDGANNSGISIMDACLDRKESRKPVFFVGTDPIEGRQDAKILSIDSPDQVDQRDKLHGTIRVATPNRSTSKLSIRFGQEVVWTQNLAATTEAESERRIEFDFALEQSIAQAQENRNLDLTQSDQERSIALEFEARIDSEDALTDDADLRNNAIKFRVWVSMIRNRVLIIDSRARWETRYIRNALERDSAWQVDTFILESAESANELNATGVFQDLDRLAKYELIILGEIPNSLFNESSQSLVERFVSETGGGLVLIDGSHGYFHKSGWNDLSNLFPFEAEDASRAPRIYESLPFNIQWANDPKSDVFAGLLTSTTLGNLPSQWNQLAPIYLQSFAKPKTVATVLASGSTEDSKTQPTVFLEQRVGSGRVFYSATDQTWKWRYRFADSVHRTFWAQVCRQYARKPFLIRTEQVELDVPTKIFKPTEVIPVRVRLNTSVFTDPQTRHVFAIIDPVDTGASTSQRFLMQSQTGRNGFFDTLLPAQPSGHYKLRFETEGMSLSQQTIAADIFVSDENRDEILNGDEDTVAMQEASAKIGGGYFNRKTLPELMTRLKSISTASVVRSELKLWESYWYFIPLILCFSGEWILRKKNGLL